MDIKRRKKKKENEEEKDGWLGKTVRMNMFTNYNLL